MGVNCWVCAASQNPLYPIKVCCVPLIEPILVKYRRLLPATMKNEFEKWQLFLYKL